VVEDSHEQIDNPTADAILDRLVHNAQKINMKVGLLRKNMPTVYVKMPVTICLKRHSFSIISLIAIFTFVVATRAPTIRCAKADRSG